VTRARSRCIVVSRSGIVNLPVWLGKSCCAAGGVVYYIAHWRPALSQRLKLVYEFTIWRALTGEAEFYRNPLCRGRAGLKFRLEDIPPEGLDVSFTETRLGPQEIGPQVRQVLEAPTAELHLTLSGELVDVRGNFRTRLLLECSRCLEPVELEVAGPIKVVYQPQPSGLDGEEVELADEDLEVSFYTGEEIDLSLSLHDEVALAVPMAPLCREDCPGLCPVCGKSRLEGECGCLDKKVDPRWAKLAKLKLE
jgi:uncharacterized protein